MEKWSSGGLILVAVGILILIIYGLYLGFEEIFKALDFITGFVLDIIPPVGLLGVSAFTYTIVGYGVGVLGQKVSGNSILITITFIFIVTLLKAAILSMLAAIFLEPGYFGYFAQGEIFLEAVMNSIITPILFIPIIKIEREMIT